MLCSTKTNISFKTMRRVYLSYSLKSVYYIHRTSGHRPMGGWPRTIKDKFLMIDFVMCDNKTGCKSCIWCYFLNKDFLQSPTLIG